MYEILVSLNIKEEIGSFYINTDNLITVYLNNLDKNNT